MLPQKIKKAVFPVAGLGTRFLPATKASPKEILPILDKPLIQYAVEEAIAAGIEQIIFVTSSSKRAIEDHFDRNAELEAQLLRQGKDAQFHMVRDVLPDHISCAYIRQSEPKGLGHAVLCAKPLIGDEPFAVLLADDLIDGTPEPCLQQMVRQMDHCRGNILAAQRVADEDVHKYGICDGVSEGQRLKRLSQLLEKPRLEDAPSNLAVIGRYILQPSIFDALEQVQPGQGGEIQLTDAIARLMNSVPTYAYEFTGKRYDCGSKLGYVQATLAYALKDPELKTALVNSLEELLGYTVAVIGTTGTSEVSKTA
jgi:UTP--glucose-1-phosphate uridylyltransferase